MRSNANDQHGGALIAAVVVTVIVAICTASAFFSLRSTLRLAQNAKFGPINRFQHELRIAKDIRNNSLIECRTINESLEWNEILPSLCFANGTGPSVPSIDYNWVFSKSSVCLGTVDTATDTCSVEGEVSKDLVVIDNLSSNEFSSKGVDVRMIASAGWLTLSRLSVEADTVVIAGSDLGIGSIEALDGRPHKVTLVSARGSISLTSTSVGISILPLPHKNYIGPPFAPEPPYPLPPVVTSMLLGRRE